MNNSAVRLIQVCLLFALAACGGPSLPMPGGPVFAFNPDKWTPAPADLTVPQRVRR